MKIGKLISIIIGVLAIGLIIWYAFLIIGGKASSTARERLVNDIRGFGSVAHNWYRESAMVGGGGGGLDLEEDTEYVITSDDISVIISRIDPSIDGHVLVNENGTYEFIHEGNRLTIIGRAKSDARIVERGDVVLGLSVDDLNYEKVILAPVE